MMRGGWPSDDKAERVIAENICRSLALKQIEERAAKAAELFAGGDIRFLAVLRDIRKLANDGRKECHNE